jgi:hypothetical protein
LLALIHQLKESALVHDVEGMHRLHAVQKHRMQQRLQQCHVLADQFRTEAAQLVQGLNEQSDKLMARQSTINR